MPDFTRLLTALILTCLSAFAHGEKLRIVTEPWAPYVYLEDGQAKGIDYEVTAEVFKRLGVEVEWQFLPWKRCLAMIEQGLADGVLDIFQTEQRDSQLFYPSEPLSDVELPCSMPTLARTRSSAWKTCAALPSALRPVTAMVARLSTHRCSPASRPPLTRPTSASSSADVSTC